jgi:hypothetical protein
MSVMASDICTWTFELTETSEAVSGASYVMIEMESEMNSKFLIIHGLIWKN